MSRYQRTKILINSRLQLKYVLTNSIFILLFSFIIGGCVYITIWKSAVHEFSSDKLAGDFETITRLQQYNNARHGKEQKLPILFREETKMLSAHQKKTINKILVRSNIALLPVILGATFFSFVYGLILSHRLAGPIFRLTKNLQAIETGNLNQYFGLREKDELKDVAAYMDRVIVKFSDTIRSLSELLINLKNTAGQEETAAIIARAEEILNSYKLK